MSSEYGAGTVGDMLQVDLYSILASLKTHGMILTNSTVPLEEMQRKFGAESIWVWNILRGIDHTEGE